jgi:hypothetical protein
MQKLRLRKYQSEVLDAIDAALAGGMLRPAVILPTGTGKTVVFSHLIAREIDKGHRVLVMVHRDELAEQAASKVRSVAPGAKVGIVKAERNEVDADVIVASVQTLARPNRRAMISDVGLVIVDECHHAVARTWMDVLAFFGCFADGDGPDVPAIGFTATLQRGDGIGLGDVWEDVVFERDTEWAIEHGHLTDVRGQLVTIDGFDLATIAKTRGDYQEGRLGDALVSVNAGEHVAAAYREHASTETGVRRGILFAPTVASAFHFADAMNEAGIRCETITGETSKEDRTLAYKEAIVLDVVGIAGAHQLRTLKDLTKIQVQDGESIEEAKERIARETEDSIVRERIIGERKSREIELFANSHSVWLQTRGGVWFIPVRGGVICLRDRGDGTWSVGRKMDRAAGEWLVTGVTFEYALSWGEQIATEMDPMVAEKDRAWRRGKASAGQVDLAVRMNLAPVEELTTMRRGAVSDLISIHFASRMLDRALAANK